VRDGSTCPSTCFGRTAAVTGQCELQSRVPRSAQRAPTCTALLSPSPFPSLPAAQCAATGACGAPSASCPHRPSHNPRGTRTWVCHASFPRRSAASLARARSCHSFDYKRCLHPGSWSRNKPHTGGTEARVRLSSRTARARGPGHARATRTQCVAAVVKACWVPTPVIRAPTRRVDAHLPSYPAAGW